jgi:hypothetical protein
MNKRVGIFGLGDETLALLPLLEANPRVEVVSIHETDQVGLADRLAHAGASASLLERVLTPDPECRWTRSCRPHRTSWPRCCRPAASRTCRW